MVGVPVNAETSTNWSGDPDIPHEPTTERGERGFHPACSCGFRAPLASTTEESALHRAQVHVQLSSPRTEGRYTLTTRNLRAGTKAEVDLHCREHSGHALLTIIGPLDERQDEIEAAVREHERDHHLAHEDGE